MLILKLEKKQKDIILIKTFKSKKKQQHVLRSAILTKTGFLTTITILYTDIYYSERKAKDENYRQPGT